MECSKRLEEVICRIQPCGLLLDVGCDHGYVPIEALRRERAAKAIAADVAEGPLRAAAAHIAAADLSERIQVLRSDGLLQVETQPDCIVMAGMGGRLMADILSGRPTDGRQLTEAEQKAAASRAAALLQTAGQLLLSPQSEPELIRRLLVERLGLWIWDEVMIEEDGKFYVLLDVRSGHEQDELPGEMQQQKPAAHSKVRHSLSAAESWTETEFLYGKRLLEKRDPVFLRWLRLQHEKKQAALSRSRAGRSDQAKRQQAMLSQEVEQLEALLCVDGAGHGSSSHSSSGVGSSGGNSSDGNSSVDSSSNGNSPVDSSSNGRQR